MRRLFIDTETGGLTPGVESLLTVGLVAHDDDLGVIDRLHIEVKDVDENGNYRVERKALETNKINLAEHDKIAVPMETAARMIYEFVKKNINFGRPFGWKKPSVYGQNVLFDIKWFDYLFESVGMDKPYSNYAPTDTLLIVSFLQDAGLTPVTKDKKLGTLLEHFGIDADPEQLHNALTDALASRELWLKLKETMRAMREDAGKYRSLSY